jgi:hypothetical protein
MTAEMLRRSRLEVLTQIGRGDLLAFSTTGDAGAG